MNGFSRFSFSGIFLVFIALTLSGCGPKIPVGKVAGNVSMANGDSPEGLLLRFINEPAGVGATALVTSDGSYTLKHKGKTSVPVGPFKISITAYLEEMSDEELRDFLAEPAKTQERITAERNENLVQVPERYHSPKTSGLSYKIVEGEQTFDIVVSE